MTNTQCIKHRYRIQIMIWCHWSVRTYSSMIFIRHNTKWRHSPNLRLLTSYDHNNRTCNGIQRLCCACTYTQRQTYRPSTTLAASTARVVIRNRDFEGVNETKPLNTTSTREPYTTASWHNLWYHTQSGGGPLSSELYSARAKSHNT